MVQRTEWSESNDRKLMKWTKKDILHAIVPICDCYDRVALAPFSFHSHMTHTHKPVHAQTEFSMLCGVAYDDRKTGVNLLHYLKKKVRKKDNVTICDDVVKVPVNLKDRGLCVWVMFNKTWERLFIGTPQTTDFHYKSVLSSSETLRWLQLWIVTVLDETNEHRELPCRMSQTLHVYAGRKGGEQHLVRLSNTETALKKGRNTLNFSLSLRSLREIAHLQACDGECHFHSRRLLEQKLFINNCTNW